ncbi:hypothetical protein C8244_14370 [Paracidovorax avenae]|uniref:hypothetical protein n=1 Tax=Paracidovorax avenae TaxID=80867 RepID=UPI000D151178|nr:hypothetical protein [Paracidovorax avenae]AVS82094.1 hypothetical protein C8237_14015 [Paracidovorax avenae]AVT17269.1 hypothetical protein C8244_14370 [Paracidovorax avenae]
MNYFQKKSPVRWLFTLITLAALVVGLWYASNPKLANTSISPRHVYRVEYYDASLIQRIIHHDMKMPTFVRLYRNDPEVLLGESQVVDMWMNGQLYWWFDPPLNVVQVGRDVVFEGIPPECTDCPKLPESAYRP